ncbi:flavin reductase [Methylococcaceae bacterium HT1]|nr:flavin reductase [Methylococcaceae bacterium HT1]TXL16557.1 flavin reductase [Methylococcaceae bacterium HT3]TXL22413.1 flavin reductase [Methylococcaceae bacterium HT2]
MNNGRDRAVLQQITQGVYVVGVADGEKTHAFTAAWVMQVSFSPVLLAISINPEHHSYQLLKKGGVCSINVLSRDQSNIAAHYGQSGIKDKMSVGTWAAAITGAPVLQESLAYFDCKVSHEVSAGDHQLVVCEVLEARKINVGDAMLYSDTGDMDNSEKLY